MAEIELRGSEYKDVLKETTLNPSDITLAYENVKPRAIYRADGSLDKKATLATMPITSQLADKERIALAKSGNSISSRAISELDAFERKLYALGITGDTEIGAALEVFVRPDNRYLFPELIERAVFLSQFMLSPDEVALTDIISGTKNISQNSVKIPTFEFDRAVTGDDAMRVTSPGAGRRGYTIKESDVSINLVEYGFSLKIYDAAKQLQTVDQISLLTQELAAEFVIRAGVRDAIAALLTAGYLSVGLETASELVWADIINLMYPIGGNPSRSPDFLMSSDNTTAGVISLVEILNLAMVTDPIAFPGIASLDMIPKLRGRPLKYVAGTLLENKLVGIRKNSSLAMVENTSAMQSEWARNAESSSSIYFYKTNRAFYRQFADSVRVLSPTVVT